MSRVENAGSDSACWMHGRGTTLLELLVVMTIFLGIMAAILSFYVSSAQARRQHERISQGFRMAVGHAGRLEGLLSWARVYEVKADHIIFTSPQAWPSPMIVQRRWPQYDAKASTIMVDIEARRVLLRKEKIASTLFNLAPGEIVSFSAGNRVLHIQVTGQEDNTYKPFNLTHDVFVENWSTM